MRTTKIILIGAAGASFGPAMIGDALLTPELRGSELWLVDVDEARLGVVATYAQRLNEVMDAGLVIKQATDRRLALPGAEFVITAVAVRRNELWQLDFQIPLKYGFKQVLGENGGPGGLFHSLRNIPMILDIARDMEHLCPQALLLNFTNPESRISLAVSRYSSINFVGLCHGIGMGYNSISRITGIDAADLTGAAAGINHFVWFLDIRRKSTNEDVYPLLRKREPDHDPGDLPLSRRLFHHFGLFPHPSDDHIGEYLPYAWEFCGLEGYDFARAEQRRAARWTHVQSVAAGTDEWQPETSSGEFAFPIIASMLAGRNDWIEAVNIRNDGLISNLPNWAVVEAPAVATPTGLRGVHMGELPAGIAALCNTQVGVQNLVVEAAVHGSRQLALQALLADPCVDNFSAAEKLLDEMLAIHAPYLPQFNPA
jgi:alpha-galactosidase